MSGCWYGPCGVCSEKQERFLLGLALLALVAVVDDVRLFALACRALRGSGRLDLRDGLQLVERLEIRFELENFERTRGQRRRKRMRATLATRAPYANGANAGHETVAYAQDGRDRKVSDRLECMERRDTGAARPRARSRLQPPPKRVRIPPAPRAAARSAVAFSTPITASAPATSEERVEEQRAPQAEQQPLAGRQPFAEQPTAARQQLRVRQLRPRAEAASQRRAAAARRRPRIARREDLGRAAVVHRRRLDAPTSTAPPSPAVRKRRPASVAPTAPAAFATAVSSNRGSLGS